MQIVSMSPMETICMKCQILFSGKNRENISKCCLWNLSREWWRFSLEYLTLIYFKLAWTNCVSSLIRVCTVFIQLDFFILLTSPGGQMGLFSYQVKYINLYLSLEKFSRRRTDDIFIIFFPENRLRHFVQIVSLCLLKRQFVWNISLFYGKIKKKYFNMSSAENTA